MDLKELHEKYEEYLGMDIELEGWIKNHRKQKDFGFIDFNDGTCFKNIQGVYTNLLNNFDTISTFSIGSAVKIKGKLIESEGSGQSYEIKASDVILIGDVANDYPLQSKGRPTREFLREIAYLRPRTNLFNAVFRIRSIAAEAIHEYFQSNNYVYVHTPLITTTDCEGSDQMFKLTTLDINNIPVKDGKADMSKDIFGRLAYITGSGQLHGETFAMAYKKIYTFGPTFRTENSNTKTHVNEFWMIEPEIAFCDINKLMDIEEDMLKFVVLHVLNKCQDEIAFCDKFVSNGLKERLTKLVNSKFKRISHHDVVDILKEAKIEWEFTPDYKEDIAKEHEKYITEYFNGPVFITDWPKDIKAWYMKVNPDGETVAAVDLEVPGAGELMGGSEREADYNKLIERSKEMGVDLEAIDWYLNLRKFGSCYHSGFGMGFERLIMYLTGVENIRDAIPYPRTPGNCDF